MRIRWPRRLLNLPLHPMLVHFPLVFWLSLPVLDLLALWRGPQPWWGMGLVVTAAGVVTGAFALMNGLLDYIDLSETGSNDVRLAARHGVRTSVVWLTMSIKLIVTGLLDASRGALWGALVVDLLAGALLLQGALFGTRIVYGAYKR
ncbi:MAG: hypothetical protein PVS2B1_22290 [Candidatus Dormibacteraceae bacterium]